MSAGRWRQLASMGSRSSVVGRRGFGSSAPNKVIPVSSVGTSGVLGTMLKPVLGAFKSPLPPGYQVDPALLSQAPTEVTVLPNGLRVASETSRVGTATVGVWIDAGTRFEPASINGAAHFLEHLIFKGTGKRTQKGLEMEIENLGAHLNAYTSREQTVYFARSLKADVPAVTELLSDLLLNSKLDEGAIDRERSTILREMQEVNGIPEEVLFDYLHESAYQGTALGKTILGPEQNIRSLKRADLQSYIDTHYKPHRMVLVGAGDIDHAELVALGEKHFGGMAADPDARGAIDLCAKDPAFLTGSQVQIRNDDMNACHYALAFETCGWAHPDAVAFMVMQSMHGAWDRASGLGDVTSNRMASAVASTKEGVRYQAFNTSYTDTGLFGVSGVLTPGEDLDDIVHEVMYAMIEPCFNVHTELLDNAKRALKSSLLSSLDNTSAVAEDIGRQLLVYGRRIPLAEMFARIDAVDGPAFKRICNKYLYDRELAVAVMGNTHSFPDYNWIRRKTYWLSY